VTVDSNETAIAIAVRDFGTGMDEVDAARVFDRFWRADPSRKRTIGGTGLGLSIAREDAALHDGVLEVWSRKGEGTCFRLTLPRHRGGAIVDFPVELPPATPRELESADA
jgi:two-component system, OmpR family, sensor histidine kinase MtrB